jgi:uncharacterized protein involved in tolerance to divalent cations
LPIWLSWYWWPGSIYSMNMLLETAEATVSNMIEIEDTLASTTNYRVVGWFEIP